MTTVKELTIWLPSQDELGDDAAASAVAARTAMGVAGERLVGATGRLAAARLDAALVAD